MGIELESEIRKVLTEMDFIERSEKLSAKYQGDEELPYGMQKYDVVEVMSIFERMGIQGKV